MTEISIVMTILNGKEHLDKCLAAFDAQTYKDFELIVVDDGSTDGTVDCLRKSLGNRQYLKLIENGVNKGIAYSRNAGLDAARGKYLMFCDVDDWYEPNMCEAMHRAITRCKAELVQCGVVRDNKAWSKAEEGWFNPVVPWWMALFRRKHRGINIIVPSKIFDLSFIRHYGIRFPPVRTNEDDVFTAQCLLACKHTKILPKRLYHYQYSMGSLSTTKKHDEAAIWRANVGYLRKWASKYGFDRTRLCRKYVRKWERLACDEERLGT